MAFADYLDGTADLHVGGETVDPTTRRPIADPSAEHSGVAVRMVQRSPVSTVYDERGQVVTDFDCLTEHPTAPTEGDVIVVTGGPTTGRFVVTGEPVVGRGRSGAAVHHLRIPCRRT